MSKLTMDYPPMVAGQVLTMIGNWQRGIPNSGKTLTYPYKNGEYTVTFNFRTVTVTYRPNAEENDRLYRRRSYLQYQMAQTHVQVPPELAGSPKMEQAQAMKKESDEKVAEMLAEVQQITKLLDAGQETVIEEYNVEEWAEGNVNAFAYSAYMMDNPSLTREYKAQLKTVGEIEEAGGKASSDEISTLTPSIEETIECPPTVMKETETTSTENSGLDMPLRVSPKKAKGTKK